MTPLQIAKTAALAHAVLVAIVVFYVTRIWNYTPLSEMPSPDAFAFGATALPPLLALWIGGWLAHGHKARRLLAIGLMLALLAYVCAFLIVLDAEQEPLAPLLFIVASLWEAAGLAVLLLAVWIIGRAEQKE